MKNINDLKLTLASSQKNPLRDRLRKMSKEQLLAERAKAVKKYNATGTLVDGNYYHFIDYLCEAKGFTKPRPGIWV